MQKRKIEILIEEFGGKCLYCHHKVKIGNTHDTPATTLASRDHDVPKCRRGYLADASNNREVLSRADCNHAKSDMTTIEFMMFRESKKLPASYVEFLEARLVKRLKLA